jgi:hypothetical protein
MKSIKITALCILIVAVFSSCVNNITGTRNTGILADDEAVSSVKQKIEDMENSLLANDGDVFWTPSGTIWHGSLDCSYLVNSKTVYHGSVEQAKLEGKERACEKCAKTDIDRLYEALEKNELKIGDVFFTRESESYHYNINCEEILGAQKIYYADIVTAESIGKTTACEKCKDK